MKTLFVLACFIICFPASALFAQDMEDFTGGWKGALGQAKAFSFKVVLESLYSDKAHFSISNDHTIISHYFPSPTSRKLKIELAEGLSFEGVISEDQSAINGFMQSGLLLYHLSLLKDEAGKYSGKWNILMVDSLRSPHLYLSVENGSGDNFQAYPVFGDDRFTGTWCAGFRKEQDSIYFTDFKTGLQFEGALFPSKIALNVLLGGEKLTQVELVKSTGDWKIGGFEDKAVKRFDKPLQLHDGWEPAGLASASVEVSFLRKMTEAIRSDSLPNVHSVLIAKGGKLLLEEYFKGYNTAIPHDMRSASKSISSAVVGIAIDRNIIRDISQSLYDFLPQNYQYTSDSLRSRISIHSLLSMSSGLDAVDFGIKRKSVASEDNYQPTPDWVKTILEAPMIHPPGIHANYGSANPYLLGVALGAIVPEPLAIFMDQQLLLPLGITNYIIQTDMAGRPYFGGGMYLRPRDMLKFGQLYLNKGMWNGKRILSERWIEQSFRNHLVLENTTDRNGYGYLWWHNTYEVAGQNIPSLEARGAGGQYIFVFPVLEAVVVITSGNYRNGKTQQPEEMVEKYILPALLEDSVSIQQVEK